MTRLLVADDNDFRRNQIVKAARRVGFKADDIDDAATEKETRDKINAEDYQLAVIDLMFTSDGHLRYEGLALIQELRELRPDCKIIAFSAQVGTEAGARAFEAGANDYVSAQWKEINWVYLLEVRLEMWRGLIEGAAARTI